MKIIVYPGADGQWYWRGVSSNGENVCNGSEGYASSWNAKRAAWSVKLKMVFAPIIVDPEVSIG